MVMSMLGVFVFAGIQATAPDMITTLDRYLDENNVYDIRIVSDMGLTQEDVDAVSAVTGVAQAEGIYGKDVIVSCGENEDVVHVASIQTDMNTLELLDGTLPQNANEIVVEENLLTQNGLNIGDTLTLDDDAFAEHEVIITGTVRSPLYYNNVSVNQTRGNTSIGSGKVNYFAYVSADNFTQDYYSAVYVTVDGAKEFETSGEHYVALIDEVTENLKAIQDSREDARYETLLSDANSELDKQQTEANQKLDDAWDELEEGKAELESAQSELSDAKQTLEEKGQQLSDAKQALDEGKTQLSANEAKLAEAKSQIDSSRAELNTALETNGITEAEIPEKISALQDGIVQVETGITQTEDGIIQVDAGIAQTEDGLAQLEQGLEQLDRTISQLAASDLLSSQQQMIVAQQQLSELQRQQETLQDQREALQNQLELLKNQREALQNQEKTLQTQKNTLSTQLSALQTLQDSVDAINAAEAQYNANLLSFQTASEEYQNSLNEYNKGMSEYQSAQQEYAENEARYEENQATYEDSLKEYEEQKADADREIANAKEEIDQIKHPTWYLYDRTDYSTYSDYLDDAGSIANLSKVFPVVFFAVAVLISLISMNRMVEEDRLEIGTLKSLGFSNETILSKYMVFSFWATMAGGVIGSALGLVLIPKLIFGIYKILFTLPYFVLQPQWKTTILGFAIVMICVCGTSMWTVYKVLREKPAELMRPKAPKQGKRVLLERIPFIWNRLKFSNKVTVRNLLLYKKRVFATVFGIAGCTALMLCGCGIKDSIADIATRQYEDIYQFDAMVYVNDLEPSDTKRCSEIFSDASIAGYTQSERLSGTVGDVNISLFVAKDDADLSKIIHLTNLESGQEEHLKEGEVIITDKLAQRAGLQAGDTIEILDVNQVSYEYTVSAVVKNYLEHFVFMDQATFEQADVTYEPNLVYMKTQELSDDQQQTLAENLLQQEEVLNVTYKDTLVKNAEDMLKSLDKVVLILVVLAAMLSFVVLYNLSNININERKREIATLKVLGFYDREVDAYITKETVVMTIIGILLGLVAGYFLTKVVVSTVEVEKARFINEIKLQSYGYAALMSVTFTAIVNRITHFHLKKINMIDSLKSVE
jgi:putative ABC transport system permease protein